MPFPDVVHPSEVSAKNNEANSDRAGSAIMQTIEAEIGTKTDDAQISGSTQDAIHGFDLHYRNDIRPGGISRKRAEPFFGSVAAGLSFAAGLFSERRSVIARRIFGSAGAAASLSNYNFR
jgi:hypothetical protein